MPLKKLHINFLLFILLIILTNSCSAPNKKICSIDSDCAAATCCHPTETINKNYAPDCSVYGCTAVCSGPLDCGAGEPACINNLCGIRSRD